ncbi:MAG TPA: hypothetical protein VMU12_01970 [Candidatus Paceibacterota bacterium]|nr:hypothetical protein [Candidatus Paceibacterota bacterium]
MSDITAFLGTRTAKIIALSVAGFVVLLLVFMAGQYVGFHKATYSYEWGDRYWQSFGGPRPGTGPMMAGQGFIPGHGTVGTIVKIASGSLLVSDQGGVEKEVTVTNDTQVRAFNQTITAAQLKVNDFVTVIGEPTQSGTIAARLIRVLPAPTGTPQQ